MIGAVVPSFDYALYARTTSALQREADARGYRAWCSPRITTTFATEVRVTQQMIQHGVDAFVFVGLDHDPALYSLLEQLRPAVRADLGRRSARACIRASASTTARRPTR